MTYPVDPASLEGDALTRWYLRSPQEIEQERQAAEAQRYDVFFGGGPPMSQPLDAANQGPSGVGPSAEADQPAHVWVASGPNRWSSQRAPSSGFRSDASWHLDGTTTPPGASNRAANQQLAASNWSCSACHGTGIAPPPPARANPPDWPRWTPGPNLTPRKPSKPAPPQCAQQNMNDSRICSREPDDAWKAVCLESASEREAHCIRSQGEVGWPPLLTHDSDR
jgi:hypothetical protein